METFLTFAHLPHSFIYKKEVIERLKKGPIPKNLMELREFCQNYLSSKIFDIAQRKTENTLQCLNKLKIQFAPIYSPQYPSLLKKIPYSPWILYYRGILPHQNALNSRVLLGIVGTRKPNLYGIQTLEKILEGLQFKNYSIVSGLAFGIDAKAHEIACHLNIPNFAVLACGLDQVYPQSHAHLAEKIISQGGGLLSEHPPHEPAHKSHFPWRNRIISGLSDLVWIVQGTRLSGSKHTGNHALDQGKLLCVTPGDIFSELSETPHDFLREGACPIMNSQDLDDRLRDLEKKFIGNNTSHVHNFL